MRHSKSCTMTLLAFVFFAFHAVSWADQNRADFDIDDDGLIEINSISDFKAIGEDISRYSFNKKLYGKNTGCPLPYCVGYELTRDLNFDENENGILSGQEKNYTPINYFSGFFEGNNFSILNLYSEQPSDYPGLFNRLNFAIIRNLNFDGDLSFIRGASASGVLAAIVNNSYILNCTANATVESGVNAGGLIGHAGNTVIFNSHVRGSVSGFNGNPGGASNMGGLVGTIRDTQIIASSFEGKIAADGAWGITAPTNDNSLILNSYAVISSDSTAVSERTNLSAATSHSRFTYVLSLDDSKATIYNDTSLSANNVLLDVSQTQLNCAYNTDQVICDQDVLNGWDQQFDAAGTAIWSFSSSSQQPMLNANLKYDEDSIDIDQDGYPASVDAFPFDDLYYADADNNKVPDDCAEPCAYSTPSNNNQQSEDTTNKSAGIISFSSLALLILAIAGKTIANIRRAPLPQRSRR